MSAPDRVLVDREDGKPSIRRKCELLGIARSGAYRPAPTANDTDLTLMRRINELFTAWHFLDSRQLAALLRMEYAVEIGTVENPTRQTGPRGSADGVHFKPFHAVLTGADAEGLLALDQVAYEPNREPLTAPACSRPDL